MPCMETSSLYRILFAGRTLQVADVELEGAWCRQQLVKGKALGRHTPARWRAARSIISMSHDLPNTSASHRTYQDVRVMFLGTLCTIFAVVATTASLPQLRRQWG
jgi:hypothetical protein